MTPDEQLHEEFWRSIALTVLLAHAPAALRELVNEMGAIPTEESLRKLRQWNDRAGNCLHVQAAQDSCWDSRRN